MALSLAILWPGYEEDYQEDGQQEGYDNYDHLPSSALPVTVKMESHRRNRYYYVFMLLELY